MEEDTLNKRNKSEEHHILILNAEYRTQYKLWNINTTTYNKNKNAENRTQYEL